ncbi:AAA family ATPase [Pacificimonas sp. ICDLI1SI03]
MMDIDTAGISELYPASSPDEREEGSERDRRETGSNPLPIEFADDVGPILIALWIIKGVLPANAFSVIYGHPGSGKTFLALDMAMHVALGWDWHGRKVNGGAVVYIGAEGQNGLRNRIVAFRQHHGVKNIPFALIPAPVNLQDPNADLPRLMDAISSVERRFGKVALVVIDTLSKTFGAGKENTDDMAIYMANCERVKSEFETSMIVVHHRPKDQESEDPRGHSSLKGGADAIILVEAGITKRARFTKQKDAEIGEPILFDLRQVKLGKDEDGDDVTSCIVQPTDVDMNPANDPKLKAISRLTDIQRIVWDVIGEVAKSDGVPGANTDVPASQLSGLELGRFAPFGQVSDHCIAKLGQGADVKTDTARRNFDRIKKRLQALGLIDFYGDWIWRK